MQKILIAIGLASLSSLAQADLQDGIQAYHRGDYAVAIEEFNSTGHVPDSSDNAAAKHYLASMYYQGRGVKKDNAKAISLFKDAANGGYLPAIANLGVLYMSGEGVEQNYAEALHYFELAAAQNDLRSIYNIGQIYQRGLGVPRDLERAASWYKRSAEAGYTPAQNEYGMLLAQGQGISLDFISAYAWINLAAEKGDANAEANKIRLLNILKPAQKLQAEALATELKNQFAQ